MGADRRAIAQNAQVLASKGQFDASIAEWKKLLNNSPADGAIYNSIGDLQLKRHASQDAVASYLRAAEAFRAEGATLKAIAAYKKILKVDPRCLEIYEHLGELNAERGLASSAVADYSTLARLLVKDGKFKEALQAHRRILKLEPTNTSSKKQAQDLASRLGTDLESFLSASDSGPIVGKRSPRAPAAGQSAPTSREGQLAQSVEHMDQGLFEEAEGILSQLLNREPGDPEVCQLLARLHLKRGELAIALNEYQFLAGAALRADDHQLAESLIREYLDVDPSCVPLLEILGAVYEKRDDPHTAAEQYGAALQLLLEQPDPDMPTLPAELYDRIKDLAPESELLQRFTPVFEPAAAPESPPTEAVVEPEAPPAPEPAPREPEPAREESRDELESDSEPQPEVVSEPGVAQPEPVAETAAELQAEPVDEPEPEPAMEAAPAAEIEPVAEAEPEAHEEPRPEPEPVPQPVAAAATHEQSASTSTPSEADLETHFVLGKAYRDMGLFSEAMEEFRMSVTSDALFIDSCLELAMCLRERGMSRRAIACLEHAVSDARCQGEPSLPLRYELGLLYEAEGLFDRALRVYESLASYQDAAKRIEWIKGGAPKDAPPDGLSAASVHAGQTSAAHRPRDRKKRRISYL